MEMFNNIKNKVLDNQLLSHTEEFEFIITAIFLPDNKKSEITSQLCYLFEKIQSNHGLYIKFENIFYTMPDD